MGQDGPAYDEIGVRTSGQAKEWLLAVFVNEFERSSYPATLLSRRWSGSDFKLKLINPGLRRIISSGENIQAGMSRLAEKIDAELAGGYGTSQ